MGYLNGSTWTFLLLKTYIQMGKRPQSTLKLLVEFFDMWDSWPWPEPVLLTDFITDIDDKKIEYDSLVRVSDLMLHIYDGKKSLTFFGFE